MSDRAATASTGGAPLAPDALRRLRHELRTPVNHLLGYAELLMEDAPGDDDRWSAELRRVHGAGRALLDPIDELTGSLREGADPAAAIGRIRPLLAEIADACDLLDAEATRIGADDAVPDIAVIRAAASHLLDLVAGPLSASDPEGASGTAPTDGAASRPAVPPGTILVVDDNPQNRQMLIRRLARLGHAVEAAPGGREALNLLGSRPFDLLLLDVMMPGMDGFEVLARLRADSTLRELPVIMLSALDEVAAAVRCIELGADDYLTKPVDAVLLRARIDASLERKRLRDAEVGWLRQAAHVTGPAIIARAIVDATPVDGDDASLRAAIAREVAWLDLPKGETLFAAGDPGDAMYIVGSGRLRIAEPDEGGQLRLLGEARRGGTLGELEMLTGRTRATTVTAVRDARLARIPGDGFERLAAAYPRLLTRTTIDVMDRLRDAFQRRPDTAPVTTFTLVPVTPGAPVADTARLLTDALASHGSTLLLDWNALPWTLGSEATQLLEEEPGTDRLAAHLNELELRHRWVVYLADSEPTAWTRRCLRQADHVLIVGRGVPADEDNALAREIAANAEGAPVDLLLLHDPDTERPAGTAAWLDRWNVRLHHHLRIGDDRSLARVVRRLTGTSVDLVLGGGGARGWAHVGVIRALEESGIEIDAIGGTSMGALLGGLFAAGTSWRGIEEHGRVWSSPRGLFDYTLPIISVIAGSKMTAMLKSTLGDARIEDTWGGYFCVSSSLTRGHPVVHRRGPIWKAVRASISMPGFLPPVTGDGELLIDGAYLDNLPTDVMRDLYGSGSLLAVSVDEAVEMSGEVDYGPVVSGWDVVRRRLLPRATSVPAPSLGVTVMRAAALASIHNHDASARLADLLIAPPVGQFGTLDFGAYQQIIDAGYEGTRRQIEQWQRTRVDDGHA